MHFSFTINWYGHRSCTGGGKSNIQQYTPRLGIVASVFICGVHLESWISWHFFFVGGLGGTIIKTFQAEGRGVNTYEGIDINNPDICPREETLRKLVEKLNEEGVLLVRSPPMAGKTSLAQLLEQYLLRDNTIRVFRISLLWLRRVDEPWTFGAEFKKIMNGTTWGQFVDECKLIKTFLIVDEVQVWKILWGVLINLRFFCGFSLENLVGTLFRRTRQAFTLWWWYLLERIQGLPAV